MKSPEKLIESYMKLYFNKSEVKYQKWLQYPHFLLNDQTPQELIDEGKAEEVLNIVWLCITNEDYEEAYNLKKKYPKDLL